MPQETDITGLDPKVLMAALSYVGVLVLIPLISGATKDPFVKFHAQQGLVIFIGEIIALIAAAWFSFLGAFLFICMFIAAIAGLFRCVRGEKWPIPLVGFLAKMFTVS